jgi:hypothetical protein
MELPIGREEEPTEPGGDVKVMETVFSLEEGEERSNQRVTWCCPDRRVERSGETRVCVDPVSKMAKRGVRLGGFI